MVLKDFNNENPKLKRIESYESTLNCKKKTCIMQMNLNDSRKKSSSDHPQMGDSIFHTCSSYNLLPNKIELQRNPYLTQYEEKPPKKETYSITKDLPTNGSFSIQSSENIYFDSKSDQINSTNSFNSSSDSSKPLRKWNSLNTQKWKNLLNLNPKIENPEKLCRR